MYPSPKLVDQRHEFLTVPKNHRIFMMMGITNKSIHDEKSDRLITFDLVRWRVHSAMNTRIHVLRIMQPQHMVHQVVRHFSYVSVVTVTVIYVSRFKGTIITKETYQSPVTVQYEGSCSHYQ